MDWRMDLMQGDCLDLMAELDDASVDSIVTDPPYGLSFMGKRWDYDVPSVEIWAECLRVLKPGGYLLAFAGTRTQHRMAVRIEDAGFEIRDMIAWVYGCLDEKTEAVTKEGVRPYHKIRTGDLVLCYDAARGEYSYQPVQEVVEYDYADTAYRLVGDIGEQVVSRNHRVIVELGGREVFVLAEEAAREQQACVPFLESLPDLRDALHGADQGADPAQQDVRPGVREGACGCGEHGAALAAGAAQGSGDRLRGVQVRGVEAGCLVAQGADADVQPQVQRGAAGAGVAATRVQGPRGMVCGAGAGVAGTDDGAEQPGVAGRTDVPQEKGCVCRPADQVRSVPARVSKHGEGGWLCDGASAGRGAGDGARADAGRGRASSEPRRDGQPDSEPDDVQDERGAQTVRAWRGHRTSVVRIEPFRYVGKVWCLRVPTGAFVAVRDGVAFPTGNSGFPKSLDVSKAIDKAAGAERERVLGPKSGGMASLNAGNADKGYRDRAYYAEGNMVQSNVAATDAARQWSGWGTSLKPALEPITVARKPLVGTVAANVLEWGTGAINVDGCRVEGPGGMKWETPRGGIWSTDSDASARLVPNTQGRWPANLIHDGSDEVTGLFPGEDTGSVARFFYCAKASKRDRDEGLDQWPIVTADPYGQHRGRRMEGNDSRIDGKPPARGRNNHPTVKPTDLMRYLCRLVTPPGGIVLDPFMGSGSTGKAAILEGFRFIGIEREADYMDIAEARITAAMKVADGNS